MPSKLFFASIDSLSVLGFYFSGSLRVFTRWPVGTSRFVSSGSITLGCIVLVCLVKVRAAANGTIADRRVWVKLSHRNTKENVSSTPNNGTAMTLTQ
jgi:hypothetical protein